MFSLIARQPAPGILGCRVCRKQERECFLPRRNASGSTELGRHFQSVERAVYPFRWDRLLTKAAPRLSLRPALRKWPMRRSLPSKPRAPIIFCSTTSCGTHFTANLGENGRADLRCRETRLRPAGPMSPVFNQPLCRTSAVRFGSFQIAFKIFGPRSHSIPLS